MAVVVSSYTSAVLVLDRGKPGAARVGKPCQQQARVPETDLCKEAA